MGQRVLPDLKLDTTWKTRGIAALKSYDPKEQDHIQQDRLGQAIENLRKQHLWGDLSDEIYRRERRCQGRR